VRTAIVSTATFLVGLALQLGDYKLPPWLADCVLAIGVFGWYYSALTSPPVVAWVAGIRRKAPRLTMVLAIVVGGMFGAAVTAVVVVRETNRIASAVPAASPPGEQASPATVAELEPPERAQVAPEFAPEPTTKAPDQRAQQPTGVVPGKQQATNKKRAPMAADDGRAIGGDTTYGDRSPIVKGDNNTVVGGDLNILGPKPPKYTATPVSVPVKDAEGYVHRFRVLVESDVVLKEVIVQAYAASVFGEPELGPAPMLGHIYARDGVASVTLYNAQGEYFFTVKTRVLEPVKVELLLP
jgi:hypothetical protein